MPEWRTLIVEDDPMVASVHRRLVAAVPGFAVVGVVDTAERAIRTVAMTRAQLILLDLTLPGRSGVELLRAIRSRGAAVEAIAVTASREAEMVRVIAHLGVVDYLVKPFTRERLGEALQRFRQRMTAVERGWLGQSDVDAFYCADVRRGWLPKDINAETLHKVREALTNDEGDTAERLAQRVGVARVTARRYLEYLVTTREAAFDLSGSGPGRPHKVYRRNHS